MVGPPFDGLNWFSAMTFRIQCPKAATLAERIGISFGWRSHRLAGVRPAGVARINS